MQKFVITFLLLIFIISTGIITVTKPKTHKPVMFESKDFSLSMLTNNTESDKAEKMVQPKVIIEQIKTEEKEQNIEQKKIQNKPGQNTQQVNKPSVQNKVQPQIQKPKTLPNKEIKAQPEQLPVKIDEVKEEIKDTVIPVQIQPDIPQRTLTEEEIETIEWNKWRADLQNKLMHDAKISAPIGTSFGFSFMVYDNGTITNLTTWTNNQNYGTIAVNVIKPILLSYQGTEILKFPKRTKRVMTYVVGGFTMARTNRFASPDDYNDYERIKK